MRMVNRSKARRAQLGLTMFGLLFWATLIGFTGYVLVRTLPTNDVSVE